MRYARKLSRAHAEMPPLILVDWLEEREDKESIRLAKLLRIIYMPE
jgi:hypothetical protein